MRSVADRLKAGFAALARQALPTVDYFALYRARVVRQAGALLDVVPDDQRLPTMSEIPLKIGIPGAEVDFAPGAYVLVGWEGGDPARPHAMVWEGGATVISLRVTAAQIMLGATDLVPLVDGVVTGQAVDSFTGLPQWALGNASPSVLAKKT